MKPKLDNYTLVMVGPWNARIFTPEWVSRELFGGSDVSVEIKLTASPSLKYTLDGVNIFVTEDRLIVGVKNDRNKSLENAELIARQCLEKLPHTPITGVGINFGFTEEKAPKVLLDVMSLSDVGTLSNLGCHLLRTEISRRMEVEQGVINLRLVFEGAGFDINMNFHQDVASAMEATKYLNARAIACRDFACDFLKNAYGLTMEEEE